MTRSEHQAADARQAAYFRQELDAARQQLLAEVGKRRPLIDRPGDSTQSRTPRTSAETEVRHIEWLIAQLDGRFAPGGDEPN